MKFVLGQKLCMTQIFNSDGVVVPVTKVKVPCFQIVKVVEKKGARFAQVGYNQTKEFRLNKAQLGQLKDLYPVKSLREFKIEKEELKKGDKIGVENFTAGENVKVTGTSKGKGFAGVVKRHHFKGGPASHGQKHEHRSPGSIGSTDAARVFKGKRMGGRMGGEKVTVDNLEIVKIDEETEEIFIKGAVPGARNGWLVITGKGETKIRPADVKAMAGEENKKEETPASTEDKPTEVAEVAEVEVEEVKTEDKAEDNKQPADVKAMAGEEEKK